MMPTTAHPEVLATDWLPPVVLGRQAEIQEVLRRLDPPTPSAERPWIVAVAGPRGSGTSAVARRAAREVADRLRAAEGPTPRVLSVRVAVGRGAHGVATALLQRLDDGFDGRGFPVREILAGFLRRLRREGRPTVLVLDDVAVGGPDLAPVLGAVADPDRFLPEGEAGMPPIFTILAGGEEGLRTLARALGPNVSLGPFLRLDGYSVEQLRAIVRDRAARALGQPLPEPMVEALAARAIEDGAGARRAIDLLRHRLLGAPLVGSLGRARWPVDPGVAVESRVVRAIGAASRGVAATLGEVRRLEAEIARSQGDRPLPTTTLWRRIVRLEQAGYVRREIRTGGNGGTRSLLRVLTPIDEWVTTARPPGTPRGFGPWSVGGPTAWGEGRAEALRPLPEGFPLDGGPD